MTLPLSARLTRAVSRRFPMIIGMTRLVDLFGAKQGRFQAYIGDAILAGDLSSFIDRQAYYFDGYERSLIECFLAVVPRGGIALDVGANIGNHSVLFAGHFDEVIAFEPNSSVLPALYRNAELNQRVYPERKIRIEPVGLGNRSAELPLYNIFNGNRGLATFSSVEQYDLPLVKVGSAPIVRGDDVLGAANITAIKIDVQGYEGEVLEGLRQVLERNRPVVWFEMGDATCVYFTNRSTLERLFPYPIQLCRFVNSRRGLRWVTSLEEFAGEDFPAGNYVVRSAN